VNSELSISPKGLIETDMQTETETVTETEPETETETISYVCTCVNSVNSELSISPKGLIESSSAPVPNSSSRSVILCVCTNTSIERFTVSIFSGDICEKGHDVWLFCRDMGLFCGDIGLLCGDTSSSISVILYVCRSRPIKRFTIFAEIILNKSVTQGSFAEIWGSLAEI